MKVDYNHIIVFLLTICLVGCTKDRKLEDDTLFQLISAEHSGINFTNSIIANDTLNILTYEYLYNGGGVGVGYFDNDSLPDLIFTGNIEPSRIYQNKGNMHFEDITERSGILTKGKWCTGVSIVDINQDGLDDIYICVGGVGNKSTFPNLLYINNGDLTFTESASDYGLADQGESIQAVFFDYDLDGDLDMYLLTGGGFERSAINIRPMLQNGSSRNTDRLYRNDFNEVLGHAVYTDVSEDAGITIEGFGLGVAVFDANNDNWPDLYISNDYLSRDLLYINQKNGSFKEDALNYFGHMSHFSMGNDVGDIDNDGHLDVVTMDMLPENLKRRKLMSGVPSNEIFQVSIGFGYGHQYMRNMLQLNNGNNSFSEIGQLSGIDKTDWSWAPLIADFDNDGLNDLFVTNGFGKDITDMDFVKFRENSSYNFANAETLKKSVIDCLYQRPAIKVPNYVFKNKGNYAFEKSTNEWGLKEASISNGAAYADLDLDGDLDLIVNNINQTAFIYRNTLREKDTLNSNFIRVALAGSSYNRKGFGATVIAYQNGNKSTKYNQPVRGFESTVDSKLHFGFNGNDKIDSIKVIWPDGKIGVQKEITINSLITLDYQNANNPVQEMDNFRDTTLFKQDSNIQFKHEERPYNDYNYQQLLLHGFSNQGPGLAVGDLNGDGLEDVFVGGSYGYNSTIFYQGKQGSFNKSEILGSELYEDEGALIFDANGDNLMDLYVTSGGTERYEGHKGYQDRLYINKNGALEQIQLPEMLTSTSTVVAGDYDNDGDLDLFVGGRVIPGKYPESPQSYILRNDAGQFTDVTNAVCPFLKSGGMITSAVWTDFNNDNQLDLVVVGEFMPITFLKGAGNQLQQLEMDTAAFKSSGLWNSVYPGDFDNDGDIDFVAGNLGLNSNLKVVENQPIVLDYADFDKNGSIDPIFSKFEEGNYYPIASLDNLVQQLPAIKKKFLFYNSYAKTTTKELLEFLKTPSYKTLKAEELRTSYIENLGNDHFKISPLPMEAQIAPVNGIVSDDLNDDGLLDLILVGNNYNTEVGTVRYDASEGNILINLGDGSFKSMKSSLSGFSVHGNSKSLAKLHTSSKTMILVGTNNSNLHTFLKRKENNNTIFPTSKEFYAIVTLKDGSKRKQEFNQGKGYISQSSSGIEFNNSIDSITLFNYSGKETRSFQGR